MTGPYSTWLQSPSGPAHRRLRPRHQRQAQANHRPCQLRGSGIRLEQSDGSALGMCNTTAARTSSSWHMQVPGHLIAPLPAAQIPQTESCKRAAKGLQAAGNAVPASSWVKVEISDGMQGLHFSCPAIHLGSGTAMQLQLCTSNAQGYAWQCSARNSEG